MPASLCAEGAALIWTHLCVPAVCACLCLSLRVYPHRHAGVWLWVYLHHLSSHRVCVCVSVSFPDNFPSSGFVAPGAVMAARVGPSQTVCSCQTLFHPDGYSSCCTGTLHHTLQACQRRSSRSCFLSTGLPSLLFIFLCSLSSLLIHCQRYRSTYCPKKHRSVFVFKMKSHLFFIRICWQMSRLMPSWCFCISVATGGQK